MLHEPTGDVAGPEPPSPTVLDRRYREALRKAVDGTDPAEPAATAGVDPDRVGALAAGERPAVTLREAAALLGTDDRWPDPATIAAGAREKLLLGMITAVVDAAAVAAETDLSEDAVRRTVTGAADPTLAEFAAIEAALAERGR